MFFGLVSTFTSTYTSIGWWRYTLRGALAWNFLQHKKGIRIDAGRRFSARQQAYENWVGTTKLLLVDKHYSFRRSKSIAACVYDMEVFNLAVKSIWVIWRQAYSLLSDAVLNHVVYKSFENDLSSEVCSTLLQQFFTLKSAFQAEEDLRHARDIIQRMDTRRFYKCVGSVHVSKSCVA